MCIRDRDKGVQYLRFIGQGCECGGFKKEIGEPGKADRLFRLVDINGVCHIMFCGRLEACFRGDVYKRQGYANATIYFENDKELNIDEAADFLCTECLNQTLEECWNDEDVYKRQSLLRTKANCRFY